YSSLHGEIPKYGTKGGHGNNGYVGGALHRSGRKEAFPPIRDPSIVMGIRHITQNYPQHSPASEKRSYIDRWNPRTQSDLFWSIVQACCQGPCFGRGRSVLWRCRPRSRRSPCGCRSWCV